MKQPLEPKSKGGPSPGTKANRFNQSVELEPMNPNAAGIDLGAGEHWVCVPPGRDEVNVRRFGCFTPDLQSMALWLKQCGVRSVAMEATGVYWIPVFQILETEGLEVKLVVIVHGVPLSTGSRDGGRGNSLYK